MRFALSVTLLHVQDLMHSLGPATPWIESLIQESSESWTLQSSEGTAIAVNFGDESGRLILSALLGRPEQEHQHAIYMTMLCANLLYAEDNAMRIALTGPSGDLMLMSDVLSREWSIATLQNLLWNFHQSASRLMVRIHAIANEEAEFEPAITDFLRA